MKKDIEKLVKKNIQPHFPRYSFVKGTFFLQPNVEEILGGFCFENTNHRNGDVYIWMFVQPLFLKDNIIYLTFGKRLLNHGTELWNCDTLIINNSELEYLLGEMKEAEQNIIKLKKPVEFYKFYKEETVWQGNPKLWRAIVFTSIWLSLPTAKEELDACIDALKSKFDLTIPWIKDILDKMLLLNSDFDNARKILNMWKEDTIKSLNIGSG